MKQNLKNCNCAQFATVKYIIEYQQKVNELSVHIRKRLNDNVEA